MKKTNPFKPQSPVNPGMFTGRIPEVVHLENMLFQTRNGNSANFMITGERGIGKSSLMLYLKSIASGLIPVDDTNLNFLVIDTDLDNQTSKFGLIRKIELGLRRNLDKDEPMKRFLSETWDFIQRLEIAGVKINQRDVCVDDELLFDHFTYAFSDTVNRITNPGGTNPLNSHFDGVLILIDEADNASSDLNFGSFVKLFTERLQRNLCNKVMVGLAGLPTLHNTLSASHASSLRIFTELPLDRLSVDEVNQVIDNCLEKANKDNLEKTSIDEEGREALISISEGYPHFIQQFGYSAFDTDEDNLIDNKDVITGALGEHGALEIIGDRYYRDDFYNKIQRESYRQVLRIMADNLNSWVSKKEIRDKFKGSDSVLNNAIKALRARHIIISKEGERGIYRLQHKGFALWIKFKTMAPKNLQEATEIKNHKHGITHYKK